MLVSVQDRMGQQGNRLGWGFWTCASGRCEYYSEREDGITHNEAYKLWPLWARFPPMVALRGGIYGCVSLGFNEHEILYPYINTFEEIAATWEWSDVEEYLQAHSTEEWIG